MAPLPEPISVRATRLNNLVLGKGNVNVNGINKASNRRLTTGGVSTAVSSAVAEAISRESLLDAFCLLYNECDKDALKRRDRNIAEFVNRYRPILEETRQLRVNVDDFNVKTLIGKGYFGTVHLVVERGTGDVYAMKKIKKSVVTTSQVKEERDIMSRHSSEWITNLQYAFQDNDNLYLVMEFLPGGDLLSLMSRQGPFDEDLARFYLSEMTMAIHALHLMGYVHRDIKPENILIDRFGHIKLADFGNAAMLNRDGQVFSLTPVGTPDYIAPELLQTLATLKVTKSLHDVTCDYWSMGVIGYELICETTPFHDENVHETYSRILTHCDDSSSSGLLQFPSDVKISANFKHLIESLVTSPSNRLSYEKIRKHPYFESVNWEKLRSQVPPIIPSVASEDDTSNFEEANNRTKQHTYSLSTPSNQKAFKDSSSSANVKSHDFSGKDLPFIGYSFVHMETKTASVMDDTSSGVANQFNLLQQSDDLRLGKLNGKMKDLAQKLKDRTEEISKLKQDLLRAEQVVKHSDSQTRILDDAKEEMNKMKNIIKEKTIELAACKTKIKTLQSSLKIEQEMWEKKEATITDLLRMNRQKYEDAKAASEQRYEKLIAEKKSELINIIQKLEFRETELVAKTEECVHLQKKLDNYLDILRQFKEKSQADKEEFEKNKSHLADTYEQKLMELRTKLRNENDSKCRLTMELKDVRTQLDDTIMATKTTQESKNAAAKSHDEILKRLNREMESNNHLSRLNAELEQKLSESQRATQELQQEVARLEREIKAAECGRNLKEYRMASSNHQSPYHTAEGSLTDLQDIEEKLRNDLETAKENENAQRERAEKLQEVVAKLEEMIEKFNEQSQSPTKRPPASGNTTIDDVLERRNEKLEDKLAAVREQMIVERQAARTANLSLWKTEKKLEEIQAEKKMIERRMELTEERIKRVQGERDEAQRLLKAAGSETKQREERIEDLKKELAQLKNEKRKEHQMWEKAEQERVKAKTEVMEHISRIHSMEERLLDAQQKVNEWQKRCDCLSLENRRLSRELKEEHDKCSSALDGQSKAQMELKNLQDNYDRLKYACTITDNQLTEIEKMLETEQKRNKAYQETIDKLRESIRQKEDAMLEMRKQMRDEQAQKKLADKRIATLSEELAENKRTIEDMQKKLIAQQQQLMEHTSALFEAQERVEILSIEANNVQALNEHNIREINNLKEENSHTLTELFHAKEEAQRLQDELKEANATIEDLQAEISELQSDLSEKENFYMQRDIKAEATLAQHKKLIDYLQLKVEDLTSKRKKPTLTDMIFGGHHSSSKKENNPNTVETSILYRTLAEELRREKQQNKNLQEQLDKLNGTHTMSRSPLKENRKNTNTLHSKSPSKRISSSAAAVGTTTVTTTKPTAASHASKRVAACINHRFELALQETKGSPDSCLVCHKPIIAGSTYWQCRECQHSVHRKCRSEMNSSSHAVELAKKADEPTPAGNESDLDSKSLDKYSYEARLDDEHPGGSRKSANGHQHSTLILSIDRLEGAPQQLEVKCAYEIEPKSIILFGCNSGLYAYHIHTQHLVHIAGIDSVSNIAVSQPLSKVILVGSNGDSLYQCDYRLLNSRCQANACLKPALEASVLDLPFANRLSSEKWQLVRISSAAENPCDSVAIAATSCRIVILKYDLKMEKFKPVRALDTATPVSAVLYTRHTAIVSSDKFYEIDLATYSAEEFVDFADHSLSHLSACQPVVALRFSRQEFLLCFMECGVFVDEYGCRSRPYDLNWEYTPTGFVYCEPYLYISHFQSVQIMRLSRSYTKQITHNGQGTDGSGDADRVENASHFKRAYLPLYTPTLLTNGSPSSLHVYAVAVHKDTGLQQIHLIDPTWAFKQEISGSSETLSSITSSITMGSIATTENKGDE